MSVLERPLLHGAQRLDLEDINLLLSALRTDSHLYTQRFLAATSYIFQGFSINQSFIGQTSASIDLTHATLINGNNTGDVSWWTAPNSPAPLTIPSGVGGLQIGRNYIELEVFAQDGTPLQRAFWDPSANSGAGLEFSQNVNTVTDMLVRVHVNQTGFTSGNPNYIQLAIIDVDGSVIIRGIQDWRKLFGRLGDPSNIGQGYNWASQAEPTTTLTFNSASGTAYLVDETITFTSGATATVVTGGNNNIQVYDFSSSSYIPGDTVVGGTSGATAVLQSYYQSFSGGDKDLKNYRDIFSALMTEMRTVKGTRFWYQEGNVNSLISLLNFSSSFMVPISSGAKFTWTGTLFQISDNKQTGQTSADVVGSIRTPGYTGNVYLCRQDGTGGSASLTIPDGSIVYVTLPAYGSSLSYSGQGSGSSNFKITTRATFVPSDKNFVIAYREGNKIIIPGTGDLESGESTPIGEGVSKEILAYIGAATEASSNPQYTSTPSSNLSNQFTTNDSLTQSISVNAANINDIASGILTLYQEYLSIISGSPANTNQITGPISASTTLTLPLDSRNASSAKSYRVRSGGLIVLLNGIELLPSFDFTELGSTGSASTTFQINVGLVVGDTLDIRVINPQFLGTAGNSQPYFVNYITGQNGTSVPVGHIYNVGSSRLLPYRDGLAINNSLSVGAAIDQYQEPNNNTIALVDVASPEEVFTFVNLATSPNVTLMTGITGTVLTVPTYTMGNGTLQIYRNGVLLTTGGSAPTDLAYSETSTTTVTLSLAAGSSDVFKVVRTSIAPTWRVTLTGSTATALTIPGSNSYVMGNQRLLIYKNGVLLYNSTVLGTVEDRYQETSTTSITLGAAALMADFFEFIYV